MICMCLLPLHAEREFWKGILCTSHVCVWPCDRPAAWVFFRGNPGPIIVFCCFLLTTPSSPMERINTNEIVWGPLLWHDRRLVRDRRNPLYCLMIAFTHSFTFFFGLTNHESWPWSSQRNSKFSFAGYSRHNCRNNITYASITSDRIKR